MRARAIAAAIVLAALAAAGGYYGGRLQAPPAGAGAATGPDAQAASAPARDDAGATTPHLPASALARPLPAPRAPLKYVFADLQARADAGDAAAATRLYRDLNLCRRFARMDRDNTRLSEQLLGQDVAGMSTPQLGNYRAQLDAVESRKQNLDGLRALCDGTGEDLLDSLVPNLQRAAQLGDAYARACYLDRGPNYDPASLLDHPQRLGAYRRSAEQMIEAGIADGDWRVIDLVHGAYQPGADNLLSAVLGRDAYQRYRYLKLYRLGDGGDAGALDRDLAQASAQLSAAQITRADAWARQTFERNFRGRPLGADGPLWDPCVFPYE